MGRWTFEMAVTIYSDYISLIFEKETKLDLLFVLQEQISAQNRIRSVNNRRREMTHPDDLGAVFFYFRCNFRLSC